MIPDEVNRSMLGIWARMSGTGGKERVPVVVFGVFTGQDFEGRSDCWICCLMMKRKRRGEKSREGNPSIYTIRGERTQESRANNLIGSSPSVGNREQCPFRDSQILSILCVAKRSV